MEERIKNLESQLKGTQEILIALVILQDAHVKFRLRKAYPLLDKMLKDMGVSTF